MQIEKYIDYTELLFSGTLTQNGPYTATKQCYFIDMLFGFNSNNFSNYDIKINNNSVAVADSGTHDGEFYGLKFASGFLRAGDVISGNGAIKIFGVKTP